MKFVCSKVNLLNGLQIVSKAVSNKTTMSILECILIDASKNMIKLTANDMELGIETIIEGEIIEKGIIALEAKIFLDIVHKLPDNDITIETTFKPFIEEFNEEDEAEVIISAIKSGRCVKTVRFSNSIDIEQITAKFTNGIIKITIPKLIIPKHKVNVE